MYNSDILPGLIPTTWYKDTGITILKGSSTLTEHIIYPYTVQHFFPCWITLSSPLHFLLTKKSFLNTKESLHVLLHSQYDNDLLGHLTPPIHNTALLFPTKIDILNSIHWPPIALLYCPIKQSGNCYAFLKMSCCNLHFPPLLSIIC